MREEHVPLSLIHIFAPAGGPEPFYAALAAGADAIYCGMGSFNARRKADNFTDETFEAACRAAHLAGSRVYVTVNIVIKDEEMSEALSLVDRCWRLGADGIRAGRERRVKRLRSARRDVYKRQGVVRGNALFAWAATRLEPCAEGRTSRTSSCFEQRLRGQSEHIDKYRYVVQTERCI